MIQHRFISFERRVPVGLLEAVALSTLLVATGAHAQAPTTTGPAAPATTEAAPPAPGEETPVSGPALGTDAQAVPEAAAPDTAPAPAAPAAAPAAAPEAAPVPTADAATEPGADPGAVDSATAEDELVAAAAAQEAAGTGPSLSVYGFADFTWTKFVNLKQSNVWYKRWSSFSVGNLNVYFAGDLGDNWRSLAEVRLLYLPHGVTQWSATGEQTRYDTTTGDYADINRPVRWGGIEIERAFLEYTPHELLGFRLGQWLSPYGIWNVDHGSPVIISIHRPYVVGEGLIPERQTGVELFGSLYVKATQLGYHLTLSNGRGPIDTYQDLDSNKAIGGRLFAKNDSLLGTLTVGMSGYRGKYTDSTGTFQAGDGGAFEWVEAPTAQYDELALAADLKWEWNNVLVQGEALLSDTAYEDSVRPVDFFAMSGPPGFTPDNRRRGFYAYGGYRTPWLNTMPYVGGEYYYIGKHSPMLSKLTVLWGGLNVRPTARVVLKAQYKHVRNAKPPVGPRTLYNVIETQAAWSF